MFRFLAGSPKPNTFPVFNQASRTRPCSNSLVPSLVPGVRPHMNAGYSRGPRSYPRFCAREPANDKQAHTPKSGETIKLNIFIERL